MRSPVPRRAPRPPPRRCRGWPAPPRGPRRPGRSHRPPRPAAVRSACPAARSRAGCAPAGRRPRTTPWTSAPPRIVELGGGGVGELADPLAGEEVVQQVGHHQQSVGGAKLGRGPFLHGQQLEEGVDRQQLHPGGGEHALQGDALQGPLHHPLRARVAVVPGVVEQGSVGGQQAEVHAPGVDPHRADTGSGGRSQPVPDLVVEAQDVPVQPVVDGGGPGGEPVQLLQLQAPAVEAGRGWRGRSRRRGRRPGGVRRPRSCN